MEKYQIVEMRDDKYTAWGKAPGDVAEIAGSCGFKRLQVKYHGSGNSLLSKARKRVGFYRDWQAAIRTMQNNSLLLLQFPFHDLYYFYDRYLLDAKKKGVRLIYMIHDVERLRGSFNSPRHEKELEFMLKYADTLIVHNEAMRKFFINNLQVAPEKIVILGIFDYLCRDRAEQQGSCFDKSLYIAGNLNTKKTAYLKALPELEDLHFELYGVNCPETLKRGNNIHYNGAADPSELPALLNRGFGLVWDGNSPDTCSGDYGEYLRYNSPHKLSLYLAAGIPVVIWEQAAQAEFVKARGVGITVSSLRDISEKMESARERYPEMAAAARQLSQQLREGYFTRQALKKAEKRE